MSKSVFVSHAVKDKALVQEIVSLIEEGIGIPEDEIFCSSLPGYGIPSGKNFVTYIKEQLLEPKVVVLVLTPAYFESKFCLSELGAAWIKSHDIFPILVPPLQYSDVKDVLLGIQVAKVDDDIKYNELFDSLTRRVNFKPKSQTKWDTKRRAFLKAIAPILKKIEGPSVVSAEEFNSKSHQLDEAKAELDASEDEIRQLKNRLAATEALKNKAEVAQVRAKYSKAGVAERFNELAHEIKPFRSVLRGGEVMKFILSNHYDKPFAIDWPNYRDRLKKKLDELDAFVAENRTALEASEGHDVPLEPGDQDFWEFHYDL